MAVVIVPQADGFVRVAGTFFRAVDHDWSHAVLAGSRAAGRYSRSGETTLYMSASREGVAAAMRAHRPVDLPSRHVIALLVEAQNIVDLRDAASCAIAGIALEDALAPWQPAVAAGVEPRSWRVRDRLLAIGGAGLIDPSRITPGLWHLALFAWNCPGAPSVAIA